MQELHSTYQALKQGTEKLYASVSNFEEAVVVSKVKKSLDEALLALEDALGITQARLDGAARLTEEAKPQITQVQDNPNLDTPELAPTEPVTPEVPAATEPEQPTPIKIPVTDAPVSAAAPTNTTVSPATETPVV